MRIVWNVLWIGFLISLWNSLNSSEESLYFDIVLHNKKVIGSLKATKSVINAETYYHSFTDIKTRILKEVHVNYKYDVTFENTLLKEADVMITVNKKPHAYTNTKWQNSHYRVAKNKGEEKNVDESIFYTTIQLYFKEPIHISHCYSEQDGSFNTIIPLGNHTFKKVNSKEKENIYYYRKGLLKKATIDGGVIKFDIIAREQ